MIPTSALFDQSTLAALLEYDPLVADYRAFFACLEWSLVDQWQTRRSARGRPSHPEQAYLKAFFVRLREGLLFTSQLRRFLLQHPLLVIELGFDLHLDAGQPYGFDVERTLPSEQWLRAKLRSLDQALLQELLHATVAALADEIPGLGEVVAFDVKHIYAWVKQNNLRVSMVDRFCKEQQPRGDPDCRVGVKRSTNRERPDGSRHQGQGISVGLRLRGGSRHGGRLWRCGAGRVHPALQRRRCDLLPSLVSARAGRPVAVSHPCHGRCGL